MPDDKFTICLNVNNIGPHHGNNKINFFDEIDSNKSIFYATNGTGKSFISRAFRLIEKEKQNLIADDLLTLGQAKGFLELKILKGEKCKNFSVSIERGQVPVIHNTAGLIFHVFNSDFVEENIAPYHYTPNGNIEGYILGKTQIDLTQEKEKEATQIEEINELNKIINERIENSRKELKRKGVVGNTTELSLLTRQELLANQEIKGLPSFDEIVLQLDKLREVPENLMDVRTPLLQIEEDVWEDIENCLNTIYPKSEWDDDFVAYYKSNRTFIENALQLTDLKKGVCPFCQQPFDTRALNLIKQYNLYRADKEASVLAQLDDLRAKLNNIIEVLKTASCQIKEATLSVEKIKEYFPSLSYVTLNDLVLSDDVLFCFYDLIEIVNKKSNDMTKVFPNTDELIQLCKTYLNNAKLLFNNNSNSIRVVNRTKNDLNAERLRLRKNLCKAKYLVCKDEIREDFELLKKKNRQLIALQETIAEKEQQAKVSRREKVYNTLTSFLNLFFNGKYTLDKDTFQIVFLGNNIGKNASRVLSDGEKSIVAYCYYLATTHLLVRHETDYEKLFFIIDDPISSMDFHYVYMVAQSLRDIKNIFEIKSYERIWVFTHNVEFLSIIKRNHILINTYAIKPGEIQTIDHRLLLPYESHLADIVKIARGELLPTHTTPNSIRHVLETVCRFEFPEKGIENYIKDHDILSKSACIFSICQDLSHGGMRKEFPFSVDILRSACQTIVDFIKLKYRGQLENIR